MYHKKYVIVEVQLLISFDAKNVFIYVLLIIVTQVINSFTNNFRQVFFLLLILEIQLGSSEPS